MLPLSLFVVVFTAFVLTLAVTPPVRNLALRWGLVDAPDEVRKLHGRPIPRLGGVAIVVAYLLSLGAFWSTAPAGQMITRALDDVLRLAPAAALVFLLGVWDDVRGLKPWQKFTGQIVAATLVFASGVHVGAFGGYPLADWVTLPATVFWLVLCMNAINLIDGVDGLAMGVALFATATILLAAMLQNNMALALVVGPLLGCLLGFLRYNFNPATIFLGDSGSLTIGFLLGCASIIWSQKSATILGMTAPLLALAIPLLDTVLSIVRRFLRGQPLFTADRGHIHHRLLDRGLTPRRAVLVIYATCGPAAALSLTVMTSTSLQGAIIALFCVATWIGVQHLGYVEFDVAGRMFIEGAFRRHLRATIALQSFEQGLRAATTPGDCWRVIEQTAAEFGFENVSLTLEGRTYRHREGREGSDGWTVRIPVSETDALELTRGFGSSSQAALVGPYADVVRRALVGRSWNAELAEGSTVVVAPSRVAPPRQAETPLGRPVGHYVP